MLLLLILILMMMTILFVGVLGESVLGHSHNTGTIHCLDFNSQDEKVKNLLSPVVNRGDLRLLDYN